MAYRWRKTPIRGGLMTPSDTHQEAQGRTKAGEVTLMHWVTEAQRSLDNDKLEGLGRARLGELILNACRYLSEREEFHRKAALAVQIRADFEMRRAAPLTRSA